MGAGKGEHQLVARLQMVRAQIWGSVRPLDLLLAQASVQLEAVDQERRLVLGSDQLRVLRLDYPQVRAPAHLRAARLARPPVQVLAQLQVEGHSLALELELGLVQAVAASLGRLLVRELERLKDPLAHRLGQEQEQDQASSEEGEIRPRLQRRQATCGRASRIGIR